MSFNKAKYLIRVLSIVLAFSVMASLISPVYATDTVDSLEQSTSDLENELSGLNKELDELSTEISSISKQVKEMTARIEEVKEELAIAKGEEEAQYEAMKLRIKYMYENGNSSLLEILFASASMADFLNRVEYVSMVNEYDRNALKDLEQTRESIAEKEAQLAQEQEDLVKLQKELTAKENALSAQISETSDELTAYKTQLEKAKEEARKAEEALKQQVIPVAPPKQDTSKDNSSSNSSDSDDDFDYIASASEIELFAALIECEAGSTNYEGMLAVASVVVNRMKHRNYPDTIHGFITQSGQFSPVKEGKVDKVLKRGVKDSCVAVANDALAGKNNVGGCLSFRAASSGHTGTIIGDNVFF